MKAFNQYLYLKNNTYSNQDGKHIPCGKCNKKTCHDPNYFVSYDDYFNKVEKFKELMNKTYVFNKYDNGIIRYGSVSRLLTLSDGDFIDLIMTKSGFVLNDPEEKVKYVIPDAPLES